MRPFVGPRLMHLSTYKNPNCGPGRIHFKKQSKAEDIPNNTITRE